MSSSSPPPILKLRVIAAGMGTVLASIMNFAGGSVLAQIPPEIPPEVGLWYDDTGRGAVRISQCGDQLCGHIHWLQSSLDSNGQPLHDKNNPDATGRDRPICGLQVVGALARQDDGSWDGGWIYDPKVGKSYDVQIRRTGSEVLEVHGYAGVKLFGKTFEWRKAPDDLPPCDPAQQQQRDAAAGGRS